jgi:excinuclease ABC subunit B
MEFKLVSEYKPTGDQPQAIKLLTEGVIAGEQSQVLLGVTGSGKTFTVANVIQHVQKPTLVLSHNKTLAAQLYGEFKQFFPENAVEYFISYYDYYQPEAFIPTSGTYIEKDLSINEEIEKLRLSSTSALLSGRRDVIVVASVSCIYGIGNPEEFGKNVIRLQEGDRIPRNQLLFKLVDILYSRVNHDLSHGNFRVKVIQWIFSSPMRILLTGFSFGVMRSKPSKGLILPQERNFPMRKSFPYFPANLFVTGRDVIDTAIHEIQDDMMAQVAFFERDMKLIEAKTT